MTEDDRTVIYEVWVDQDPHTFAKLKADNKFAVVSHITGIIEQIEPHQHVHIVAHYDDEYEPYYNNEAEQDAGLEAFESGLRSRIKR